MKHLRLYSIESILILTLISICLSPETSHAATKNKKSLEVMRQEATTLFEYGSHKEALPILKKILDVSPKDATALRYMMIFKVEIKEPYCRAGAAAYFNGDFKGATAQWEKVLETDPDDSRVRGLINEALLLSNRSALTALYASAERLIEDGKYNDAIHDLEKILTIEPAESKAQQLLATISASIADTRISSLYTTASELRIREEFNLAIDTLNQILQIDPSQTLASRLIESTRRDKHNAIFVKARHSTRQGRYIQAREQYENLISALPDDRSVKMEYERLSATISIIKNISSQGPAGEAMKLSIYNYIVKQGNHELAIVAARHALDISSNDETKTVMEIMTDKLGPIETSDNASMGILDSYLLSALDNIYEGKYGIATRKCSIVLALDADNTLALKRLGSAFYLMGNKKNAASAWSRASKLAPDDNELKEFIEMVADPHP